MQANISYHNPYTGPRTFLGNERDIFFGREREIRDLFYQFAVDRIVLLHSPAGSGKTSLIHAGLIPRLESEGFLVFPIIRVSFEPPVAVQKESSFNRFVFSTCLSLNSALPPDKQFTDSDLARFSIGDFLQEYISLMVSRRQTERVRSVLIFDQFEEVLYFEPFDVETKRRFFDQLGSALRDTNRWALFAIREDFMPALEPYTRSFPTGLQNTYRLEPLSREAALQAVLGPARQAGVDFSELAARKLVDDLSAVRVQQADGTTEIVPGMYVEPVQLQVACHQLWEHLAAGQTEITERDLSALGDTDQSLAEYYASKVHETVIKIGGNEQIIRQWFESYLIGPEGTRLQVLMEPEQTKGISNQAIELLQNAGLLRTERRGGQIWLEIPHDRLVGPIKNNNAAWFEAHSSLLERQAALWVQQNRSDAFLLNDEALREVDAWQREHSNEITDIEKDFLDESQKARVKNSQVTRLHRLQLFVVIEAVIIFILALLLMLELGK